MKRRDFVLGVEKVEEEEKFEWADLPVFDETRTCPKCQERGGAMTYVREGELVDNQRSLRYPEHLSIECGRCGYVYRMACAGESA